MANGPSHGEIKHSSRSQVAHERSVAVQHAKAVQVVAAQASGRNDCIELLAMLGLNAQANRQTGNAGPLQ